MKKFSLFSFVLILSLILFGGLFVKADTALTMTNGASVRLNGEYQGLRFIASVEGETIEAEHGFFVAIGNHSLDEMREAIGTNPASTVGENKLVKVTAEGTSPEFAVTIYGITEEAYTLGITAVAYVYENDEYILDKAVTKNITEVAFAAIADGKNGDILNAVANAAKSNYMIKSTTLNSFGEYTFTKLQTVKYGYSNKANLYSEFIADYNAATGASLTTSSPASAVFTSFAVGITGNTVRNLTGSNIAKFFDGANMVKWGWILEYFEEYGENIHIKNQANGLLRADRTCQSSDSYKTVHLSSSIYNLFKGAHETNGYSGNDFTGGASAYANVTWPSVTNFNDENVVRVGDTITLPAGLVKSYYDFTGYNDGINNYAAGASYTVPNTAKTLKPVYSPTNYTITYNTKGGVNSANNPATYNIETNTIILASASKDNYVFAGWYDNEDCEGLAIDSITKGSHGNINLYANWAEPEVMNLNVTANEVTIFNSITPTIIVKSGLSGIYHLTGEGIDTSYASRDYTIGQTAFTTIASALQAAEANDIIYVFAGTYSDAITISDSNIKLIGPNYNVNGYDSRQAEAIIAGRLDINATNAVVNGLKFDGGGLIYTNAAYTTIEYIYTTATPVGACIGYDNRLAQLCGNNCQYLKVKNSWFNTPATGSYRGAIVVAGNTRDTEISYNRISNTARINSEVIMMYNVVGVLNIKNNTIDALTSGYSIRLYNGYYSDSAKATEVNITNNIIKGTSDSNSSSGIQIKNFGTKGSVVLNVIGNDFEHVTGNTFNLESCTANATFNLKYNYFQYSFKFETQGSGTKNYVDNYYASAQTTATPDVSVIKSKQALISAYTNSADFVTYGSVCVYAN